MIELLSGVGEFLLRTLDTINTTAGHLGLIFIFFGLPALEEIRKRRYH